MTGFRESAAALLGPKGFLTDSADMESHCRDWRGIYQGSACGVALPASTAAAAALVGLCRQHGMRIVPQGGNTGLSGAAVPDAGGNNVIVNMRRMNRIRALDPLDNTITVEAGCILADIQAAAAEADRLFPLSLAAEGSCQIGGNLSTNAGGINVLRYGNARDLALGLEVVLADGSVLDALGTLRKDNTGYDLKQAFIGAEGTLGLITAASLKLFPALRRRATALVALRDLAVAPTILSDCRRATADQLVSFELLPAFGIELAKSHGGARMPLDHESPWFLLIEAGTSAADFDISGALERALGEGMAAGGIADGLMAESEGQRRELWRLREAMVEAQPRLGAGIKHDIAVPVAAIPAFVRAAMEAVARLGSDLRPLVFGHVGDGNLHFNVLQPAGADSAAFQARTAEINRAVHDCVLAYGGSISAEHGIGQLRRDELARVKSPVALAAMRAVKRALDPDGLFNPGKVF